MSKTRLWVFGAVAAMLVVVVGGWALGISPVFSQISATSSQLTTAQSSSHASQIQLSTLKTQFKNIGKLKKKLNSLRLSIPEEQSASLFLDEIAAAGTTAGVQLQNVSIASAVLYTSSTAPAGAAASAATSTSTPTPAPAVTTPVPASGPTTGGLILIPVTITVMGGFEATREFADYMSTGTRLLVASGLTVTTDPTSGAATTTITGNIFSLPGTSDAPKKSTSGSGSISTSTPTPSATPTPTPTPTPTDTKSSTTTSTKGNTTPTTAPSTPPVTPSPTDSPAGP